MAVKKADKFEALTVHLLKEGHIKLRLIGRTPFYFNTMSSKAKRTLLIGGSEMTLAERRTRIKHDSEEEFRESVYTTSSGPTRLCFPASGVKAAMCTAALETAGVTKKALERMIFLPQQRIPIWGKPFLKMDVVTQAGMTGAPDIRTRAFLPEWCSEIDISFVTPRLNANGIVTALANAGLICGLGDYRQEKGKGNFGAFHVVMADDMSSSAKGVENIIDYAERWNEITKQDRKVQDKALKTPIPYDEETENLLNALHDEVKRRAA